MGLVSDELGALLKIVNVAVRVPTADGAKFTENLQVAPGGTDAPWQVLGTRLKSPGFAPEKLPLTTKGNCPVLVTVMS